MKVNHSTRRIAQPLAAACLCLGFVGTPSPSEGAGTVTDATPVSEDAVVREYLALLDLFLEERELICDRLVEAGLDDFVDVDGDGSVALTPASGESAYARFNFMPRGDGGYHVRFVFLPDAQYPGLADFSIALAELHDFVCDSALRTCGEHRCPLTEVGASFPRVPLRGAMAGGPQDPCNPTVHIVLTKGTAGCKATCQGWSMSVDPANLSDCASATNKGCETLVTVMPPPNSPCTINGANAAGNKVVKFKKPCTKGLIAGGEDAFVAVYCTDGGPGLSETRLLGRICYCCMSCDKNACSFPPRCKPQTP